MLVQGIFQDGVVKLKNNIEIPENSEVIVLFKDKSSKANFLESAGSWKDLDTSIFDEILDSRKNDKERNLVL